MADCTTHSGDYEQALTYPLITGSHNEAYSTVYTTARKENGWLVRKRENQHVQTGIGLLLSNSIAKESYN